MTAQQEHLWNRTDSKTGIAPARNTMRWPVLKALWHRPQIGGFRLSPSHWLRLAEPRWKHRAGRFPKPMPFFAFSGGISSTLDGVSIVGVDQFPTFQRLVKGQGYFLFSIDILNRSLRTFNGSLHHNLVGVLADCRDSWL
jgi:hypothetical protein